MMGYEEAVNYIHSFLKFGVKLGLERMQALLNAIGNPEKNIKYIHVAGTNGKGTTSTMLSNILIDAGYKTGLFTSPYVFDFCERIRVNSVNIPHGDLADVIGRIKPAVDKLTADGIEITEFELITAVGLLYFSEQGCDYAVMEVGLGGRFDATNVIPAPTVSVITSISYDHIAVLGDTIEKIAGEKCGIIKHGSRVVTTSCQNPKALGVIEAVCADKDVPLCIADYSNVEILSESISGTNIEYLGNTYHIPLVGRHQIENTIGVIEAACTVDNVSEANIQNGIRNTVIKGRMELIDTNTLIDGGHNEECALALADVIKKFLPGRRITAVIGMMADKECEKYLEAVLPLCNSVVFTRPSNPRSETPERLTEIAKKYIKKITVENSPKIAYYKTKEQADFTLVCGSFYMLSDIFN